MVTDTGPTELLERFGLKEYEATALGHLITAGRTTAPDIAEATGIPKARVYGVLESLAEQGYIRVIPGRPKQYQPKEPAGILDRAKENRRQEYEQYCTDVESMRKEFLSAFEPRFEQSTDDVSPTEELLYVVDVGVPSERETRTLYAEADDRLHVLTKSFEYFDSVEPAFRDAVERGVDVDVLFLHPDLLEEENRSVQARIVERIDAEYPDVGVRFSEEQLPWRGTFADPDPEYETGKAIFLVEEKDIPLYKRQAAITENGSFVAGLGRYFELVWEHESVETYPGA